MPLRGGVLPEGLESVPLDVAAVGALLAPAEGVGQGAGLGCEEEVEAGVGLDHHPDFVT